MTSFCFGFGLQYPLMVKINQKVLMSGTQYFSDAFAINALMDSSLAVDAQKAAAEHAAIKQAFESAGIEVIQVEPPANCQDGVYTANWGLCRGNKVIPSVLPNKRDGEMPYARKVFADLGLEVIEPPNYAFSGQGDALPCGNLLFAGSGYRSDWRVHEFIAKQLGFEVIALQTIPQLRQGQPVINPVTGWPDSFFYDIDLALSVISPELIAWCPEAFLPHSQEVMHKLPIEKIEVSFDEAVKGFACNLVSTGETVIMSGHAPQLKDALETKGLTVITPEVTELLKGGGFIRCVSLSLDNY